MRNFRFGVAMGGAESARDWVEKARRAESLGYSTLLLPDHYVSPLATVPALSVAASATSTLRVGSFVFSNDFRHPAMVAKEAATLDLLSDGRFELGLGAGWHGPEYAQAGISFDPPGARVGRLEEAVAIVKGLFGPEPVSFAGEHYRIEGLHGTPSPVQSPHPPILIAGGSKRVLSLAGREADIVGLHFKTFSDGSGGDLTSGSNDATAQKIEWVRSAAGDRFDELELNVLIRWFLVTDNPRRAAVEMASRPSAVPLSPELLLDSPNALFGSVEAMVETLVARREQYGISYIVVVEDDMEAFAPVVSQLSGT
jgi:probable F420-dependent oxidoreductase